jgi:hypothetical protein
MLAGEELHFRGPYEWFGPPERTLYGSGWVDEPGVYLWTIPTAATTFTPYFVGETGRSFAERFAEHTRAYLGGEYTVWEPEDFLQKNKVEVWGGLWKPERRKMFGEYLENLERLNMRTLDLLRAYRIFLAPMRGSERMRERVEAAIIRAVRLADPHPFLDENLRYRPRLPSEPPVNYEMHWPAPVEGVPTRCQV